ncbi:uncharacterized protein FMAN_07698 [Fusarium mangiferae]|uniref:LIM zinc-binding domain-containing protein n=1 Tax=Fusarium mangiferae TaxID=192010 RepID=A0A1L7T2B8_FUSMA|nr:uncharacterized protein FMAN_07698 [Fusarium mangiferae]CVK92898.1 uncharacterized protein FMAN_07698 [Fusarium mangiferae]
MAIPRESMFLPTIKCSSCNREVEISMMGDHVCAPPAPELSPPPERYEAYTPYSPASPEKPGRIPSSLDVNAANHPFLRQGQLTPNSEPRSTSPVNEMECFFDDVPTPHEDDLILPSPRPVDRPGAYGGFGEKKHGPDFQPRSISPNGGVNATLFKRMDTIAPGPFDTIRSPSALSPSFPKEITEGGDKSDDFLSASPKDYFNSRRSASPTDNSSSSPSAPPQRPTRDDYEGFGRPSTAEARLQPQPLGMMNRSDTFPKLGVRSEPPLRTPSAPGTKPERKAAGGLGHASKPSMGPDTSRAPPPRKSLLHPSRSSKYSGSVDLAAEFGVNNPYHTPSDSTSSGFSTFSHQSHGSSQTSQSKSLPRRDPSDLSAMDGLMEDLESSMEALGTKDPQAGTPLRAPSRTRSPLAESPLELSPRGERPSSATKDERRIEMPLQRSDSQPRPLYATSPQDHIHYDKVPELMRAHTLPPPNAPPVRKGSQDPVRSRGNCKACGLAITGKSISSADGRLTGKYHKACFVCTTCSEPFTSAEFYVLNDKPYCEHHYHKLNGSLCGSCEKGIEGQYLEDEFSIKYHIGCFRCLDCGRSLSDGYFEVDGKSYCERDAWRRVQQPYPPMKAPPGRSPSGSRPPMMGLPGHPAQRMGPGMGPAPGMGLPRPPYGMPPPGNRLAPGLPGPSGPRPRMNKRNTRLGMM